MVANSPVAVWLRLPLSDEQRRSIVDVFDGCEFFDERQPDDDPGVLERIQVVFSEENVPDETIARMPALRWFHGTRGGLYSYLTPQLRQRPIPVTGSRGIHGGPFSEFGITAILALAKRLPELAQAQRDRRWAQLMPMDVAGATLGIIGLGTAGSALAVKAHALSMRVLAVKRTPGEAPPEVERLGTAELLPELLRESDFVAITTPGVPSTKDLLGEAELRLMKTTAYLINITGGNAVAEDTLVKAIEQRWIAGAWIDALPRRPLPPESRLWDFPNVVITSRVAGLSPNKWPLQRDVFVDNLRRFLNGEPLRNVMDKELGY